MTITEVSKKFDLSADTLRYYERIGLIPKVNRTPGGIRNYDEMSCKWIALVKCMRSAGVPIEALIEYCTLMQEGDSTITARKEILIEERKNIKNKIAEMQSTLAHLEFKIERYERAEETGVLSWDE